MGYKAKCAAITLVVMLAGCSPKVVYVPVSTCPPPDIGVNPELPISRLSNGADVGTVLQHYSASLEICKGRVKELIKKLEAYKIGVTP